MRKFFTDPATRSRPERFHDAPPLSAAASAEKLRTGVPEEFYLGKLRIAPATVLAPMAGVTDTVFRRFIKYSSFQPEIGDAAQRGESAGAREQGAREKPLAAEPSNGSSCGLIMTEFTSADGI